MRSRSTTLTALVAATGLVLAACGGSDDASPTTVPAAVATTAPEPTTTDEMLDDTGDETVDDTDDEMGDDAADSPSTTDGAAELRSTLTSLLQEHVYLAGIAISTAVDAGGDLEAPAVQAAVSTLDANSVALADVVGSVAGAENGEAFLGLWRQHIGFFVDYTLGRATGDDAMVDQALTDLAGYEQAAGAFFEDVTGGAIVSTELQAGLQGHITTLSAAIDSVVAGEADAFDRLRDAAHHMFGASLFLATGIAEAAPEMFPGDVSSGPSEVRAVLTDLLQEHVYLAGIAISTAVDAGGDLEAPAVQAAVSTLDANSVALADVVGSVAGAENGEAFLGLWRQHIGFFVDYTLGRATGDDAMVDQARTDLEGYQVAAGAFFEDVTAGAIPAADLIASLDVHVETVFATIDSLVTGDGQAFDRLRDAAQHMPHAALALATGVVAATS